MFLFFILINWLGLDLKYFEAEVPFKRPAELADDYTSTDEVFIHALNYLINNDKNYRNACCIYPAAPLLTISIISNALDRLNEKNAISCFPVIKFCSNIFRALEINEQGRLNMIFPENKLTRTQDLKKNYHDAGQFYWVNIKKYLKEKSKLCDDSTPIVLSRYNAVDIDTNEDWKFAELLHSIGIRENLPLK